MENSKVPKTETDNSEQNSEIVKERRRLDWVAIFTGLLFIVGVFQIMTYVATDRAYLSLDSIYLDGPPLANQPIVLRFQVTNHGRTAALVTDANMTVQFMNQSEPLPDKPHYIKGGTVGALAGPIVAGGTFNGTCRPRTGTHQPFVWHADAIPPNMSSQMYVYGFIKYDDGFSFLRLGKPRITGFCARYNPQENPAVGTFVTCDRPGYRY